MQRFLDSASSLNILVIGDVMLDAYVAGDATRISPEAPVPVVAVSGRRYQPGGAANVAANIRGLGARVVLSGVTGIDDAAMHLRRELERIRIDTAALLEDPARVTTTKTRITAGGQQIVRFDEEDVSPLSKILAEDLQHRCEDLLSSVDACVISDYAKGVVSDSLSRCLIAAAAKHGKPLVVDPKSRHIARYRGATVITPNLKETSAAAGVLIHNSEELAHAAAGLLARIAPSALLVTCGGEGMSLFEPDPAGHSRVVCQLPALNIEVADVTGAGDTVVGVLAVALGLKMDLREAARIANLAAGLAVRHAGTWAVQGEELLELDEAGIVPDSELATGGSCA